MCYKCDYSYIDNDFQLRRSTINTSPNSSQLNLLVRKKTDVYIKSEKDFTDGEAGISELIGVSDTATYALKGFNDVKLIAAYTVDYSKREYIPRAINIKANSCHYHL